MVTLSKENVVDYVKSRLDFFNPEGEIKVSAIGEGSVEEDGDGFINFVYRVSDGEHHLIVKQSRPDARLADTLQLDLNRFKLEYDTMKIRKAIVPDLIPDLYDCDEENRVFITEDVSYLQITRFQLLKGVTYPRLADQIARYMAATEFYTSEYYLDSNSFRNLSVRFMNSTMRDIMDVGMFLTSVSPEDTVGRPLDPDFAMFSKRICADPKVLLSRQKLKHLFMSKGECLIHGDLHTSNIFADQNECKIIDMEYTFCGPFSYDLGYFTANFIAQYASATFRPFESEEKRAKFKAFCLSMIRDTYLKFCDDFCQYCHEDSKPEYRNIPGLEEDFRTTTLREFIGFAASAMLGRICGVIPYPDYDSIEDSVARHNAKCFSIIMDRQFLVKWESYHSIDEIIKDIFTVEEVYCRNIRDLNL
ncbi:MAG: phosphotransferase [Eubacterium sp.]|nr:phosphotransferase [Eubacterium sp.]MDD7210715.1 phosphotransferase [Lachnospiraceae bacterium]MDY5496844.1 phosphotransferase [Anaerobutyricum sp.]